MRALGRDIAAVAAGEDAFRFHHKVGLVFQDPDIQLFSATVFDDVAFGPLQLGLSPAEVKAACDEALRQMEITHLADRAHASGWRPGRSRPNDDGYAGATGRL